MKRTLWAALIALLFAAPAVAQNARDGRLIVTVADQTGAIVPGATVTLRPRADRALLFDRAGRRL